ncbi:hypothetical protein JCM9279_006047 [Rhodotorula babjevae]
MGELVPDTPRGTAEPHANQSDPGPAATEFLDSHGQSYLLDILQADSSRRTSSQGPSASLRHSAPSAGPPRIAGNVDDDVDQLDDDDNAEPHSIPDSQQLLPPDDEANTLQESLPVATPAGGRPLLRSQSALVLGPDDPSGYSDHEPGVGDLGETQAAHSLDDDDNWRSRGAGGEGRRRSSGGRESSRASLGGRERERERDDEGEDDVSMDMTRAVGRVLPSQDGANELAPRASDSQKENPPPSHASARSQQGYPPFSLSVQSNVDDASGAPSSSPAVAQHLLASRRPPTRKTSPSIMFDKPTPSANNAPSSASGGAGSSSSNAWSTRMSGPETSTPAFANVPPPAPPVTATRTLPALALASPDPLTRTEPLTRSSTLPPAAPPRRAQPAALVNSDLFASSAAMKAKVPDKKKRRAEAWDGISQSDESVRAGESLATSAPEAEAEAAVDAESATLPPTLVHEAGEPGGGPSGAEGGTREEQEEGEPLEEETPLDATVRHDDGAGGGSLGSSLPASAGPVAEDEADESSLDPLQRRNPNPLFFDAPTATASSSGSSPGSRSPVKANAATTSSKGKNRLSDISELKSSLEPPSQAIEVPATQTQYDALRPASLKTQDVEVDKSWHASFQHDTSTDSAATRRQSAPAPATRALKRVAPPPTPLADDHASTSSSASTSRPLARLTSPHDADADADADASTIPQPTQHLPVPESSPEVPLHRAAAARARSPFPPPRHAQAQAQAGPSGRGVVVPDSDGPTQEDQQLVAASGRAVAAAKAGRSRAPAHDVAMDVDEPMLEQEFGGGFDEREEDQEMRDEGALLEEEDKEEELRAPVSAAKGKDKAKAKPKPQPVQRAAVEAPEPVKKAKKVVAPPPPKGKGKTKASSRASASCRRRSRDDEDDEDEDNEPDSDDALDLLQETNYSAPPALKNSKGRLARSSARPPVVKKDKGKRRASATPPPLDEVDEDAPSPRKKRKMPATPVVEIPAGRRESIVSSPARKAPSSRTTSAAKKRVAAPPSTVAKKRPRRSSASASPARADSPEPPVAGPSRARLRSASRSEPARTPSPALTTDSKPSIKSRLLPTAPFTRVLAFWRDGDTGYYPGTIVALVGGKFDVLFDDGSRGKILADEIRRCELVEDDRCTSWEHEPDTETQAGSLDRELVVTAVEREAPDDDDEAAAKPGEGLAADDVLVVRAGTRTLRIPVSAIRISPRNALQLDDRRLTDDELALFEGKERPRRTALQRLDLVKAPKAPAVDEMRRVSPAERGRLFGRTAFIVTTSTAGSIAVSSASSSSTSAASLRKQLAASAIDRDSLIKQLEEHGATIIDWQHLFRVKQPAKDDASPVLEFRQADFRHVEDIFLLTNRACQTSKYLVSLALGVPCLSLEFAVQSMAAGALLDWRPFLLTAGFLHDLGTYGLGSQLRALAKTEYGLESLAAVHAKGGVFKDKKFVVVMRKGDKAKSDTLSERSYAILSLLTCASAHLVHFVATPADARAALGYDYVFLEDDAAAPPKPLLKAHRGLVNMVWLKQCLMAGRLLPAERMRQVDE